MKTNQPITSLLLAMLLSIVSIAPAYATEILTVESKITASQEQPKLLVIIPWKKTEKAQTIEDNILEAKENFFLQPLDRKPFLRYSNHLQHLLTE